MAFSNMHQCTKGPPDDARSFFTEHRCAGQVDFEHHALCDRMWQ